MLVTKIVNVPYDAIEARLTNIENLLLSLSLPSPKPKEELDTYLTKKQAANIANVSISTINNWRRAGLITFKKFGNVARIKRSDFEKYLEKK